MKNEDRAQQIVRWTRVLHAAPELSGEEYETTAFIRETLASLGVEVLDAGLKTGVIGLLRGGRPGQAVALRADIDALPVAEDPAHAVCSCKPGVMHACGHDVHISSLLGAAAALAEKREALCGSVLFLFQSAEEIGAGARQMLDTGVLRTYAPKAILAQHVLPDIPEGKIGVRAGPVMAAQALFTVRVSGRGGHAAAPERAHDPVLAGAAIVCALQSLASRRMRPSEPFVLSVCTLRAGTVRNVIPDAMELGGTFRFADNALREQIRAWIADVAQSTALAYGCTAQVSFERDLPAVVNEPALLPAMRGVAESVFGPENVLCQDFCMISEDFAFYAEQVPTFMFYTGCGVPGAPVVPLHSARLQVGDGVPVQAAALFVQAAVRMLEET